MSKRTNTILGLHNELLKAPERVPFGALKVDPSRFQSRNPQACNYVQSVLKEQESRALTASLLEVIEAGEQLDPIVVWQCPEGHLWIIDGHHRHESLQEAGTPAKTRVWVQRFKGESEADARHFSLDVNKRSHLNMHRKERIEAYWKLLVSGEAIGSVRGRVARYGISKATVQRMDKEAPSVIAQLRAQALAEAAEFDVAFIRTNAPAWKTLADWRDTTSADTDVDDLDRKTIERIVRSLAVRLSDDAKANPDVVVQAFAEFIEEVTGRHVSVRLELTSGDDDQEQEAPDF